MSKRQLPAPTFAPRTPLRQLLDTADLPAVVPRLPPRTLHRLVGVLGLEDAGEVLSLATPAQLVRVLDMDTWQRSARTATDDFDPHRFGQWLRVLVEEGVEVAASKLLGFDRAFVITVLAQHIAVTSRKTAAVRGLEDDVARCELGGMLVLARRDDAWDALVPLLAHLQTAHPGFFTEVMTGCRELSYEYLEEASGFDQLLGRREQALADLAAGREERLEQQGYVTRPRARAFLTGARRTPLRAKVQPTEWEARRYFQGAADWDSVPAEGPTDPSQPKPPEGVLSQAATDAALLAALINEADGHGSVRGLLTAAPDDAGVPLSLVAVRLGLLARTDVEGHARSVAELGFLSNVLLEGGVLPSAHALEPDAVEAAVATCDLGLHRWPPQWPTSSADASLVEAFAVGWTVLHEEVCLRAAQQLAVSLRRLPAAVRSAHDDVLVLRRSLERSIKAGAPWEARGHLDVLAILDTPAWATLLLLINEYPVVPNGCLRPEAHARRLTTDTEFISSDAQIAWVGQFLAGLGEAFAG